MMMAIDDSSDCIPPWGWDQDCIEVDNIVPGMPSQADQMPMQYGDHDRIQELLSIVPHGVHMLAESFGNGRPSELQNHIQNGMPKPEMIRTHPREESISNRLQHVLRCLRVVGPFGYHIGPEFAIMIPKPVPNVVAENVFRETASPQITLNDLRKTASPQMCALEDLEFGKRFLILSYLCQ